MKKTFTLASCLILGCLFVQQEIVASIATGRYKEKAIVNSTDSFYLKILGIAQDAGYPQIGCMNDCCKSVYRHAESKKNVVALALINSHTNQYWLFEATPDISSQLLMVQKSNRQNNNQREKFILPQGIFISHAHIGHYTGLMQLGREALNASNVPVYCMPKMEDFIRHNGPWSQLVSLNNILIKPIQNKSPILLDSAVSVEPIQVPHRDEFSETIGFLIKANNKKILFIPDIDKWNKWNENIITYIHDVDIALLDGTFFRNGELPNRDMKEVPHPFVEESVALLSKMSAIDKSKVFFIHFNHTNPLLKKTSPEKTQLKKLGFGVAEEGMIFNMQ